MSVYTISTPTANSETGSSSWLSSWSNVLNALRGRWGVNNWTPITTECTWHLRAGEASFYALVPDRGDISFALPIAPAQDAVLHVFSTTSGVTTINDYSILAGMETIALHLSGDMILISANYETRR